MRKFLVSIVLLCCISSLQAESLIYSTSFTEWSSQTYTGQQMMRYSGIDFTVCYVKIDPNSKPTSVSSYEGTGYLQPSNGSNLSSCYFQTGKLSYVSRVSYTQAAGTIGCGWRLESSNDGVYFYPFNENETGCTSMKTPETKEVAVYMSDVWLRWTPITTGSTTTNIYLMDINIYGDNSEGGMGGNDSQPVVSIAGSMNEWSMSENTFTPNEDGLSAGISMYLAAGSYEFKIVLDNSIWRSLNGDNGDLYTFHRDWTTASNITEETASNFKLNADVEGEYKFTWTYSDNSLSIVFPEQTGMGDGVTYYLIGNSEELGAWDIASALPMDGGLITVNLPAGSYAIKVLDESKNWDTAMGYLNVNNSCSSSGIAMDEDKNAVFVLEESGSVTVSASEGQICLNGAFKVPDVGQYTNFAALVNHDSTYNCYYAGKAGSGYSQYLAHVRLNEGDTLRIINRADGNSVMQAELDSYGLTNNFVSGDYNRYHVCVVDGCYDVYYSFENLYIGAGSDCSSGAWYDGAVLPTGWVQLRIKDGQYGYGHVSIDGEGADSYEGKSGIYVLGMELNFEAQPTSGYQFLQWSDNNYANPRPFVVTGDTIIYADFGSLDHYPTGILLNHKKFIRSTYNDGRQLIVRANIQDGDTVELYFLNDNIYWMAELEPYGKYESFSGGAEQGHLICHETGCYDIYFKLQEGITQTIYIGEGTQCFDGVDWTAPAEPDYVYSLVGTANLFGEAWVTQDTTTEMKLQGENMYTYTIDSIALYPDSSYQYKVISNHEWNVKEYPNFEENYNLSVEEPGVYQVLFTLNPDAGCSATPNYLHAIQERPYIIASGKCGADADSANVTWSLSCDSVLTISGTGAMAYWTRSDRAPWYENYRSSIKSIIFDEGISTIGNYAFYECNNLTEVTLPNNITRVGDYAFYGSAIATPLYNNSIFAYLPTTYKGLYSIPYGIETIAGEAFINCSISSIDIPNSVKHIGNYAFSGCLNNNFTSINIPNSVTTIGVGAFSSCTNLSEITLSENLTSLGEYAFYLCSHLTSVNLPNSLKEIGQYTFQYSGITTISIPENVTDIDAWAFSYCTNLTTVKFPKTLKTIGHYSFSSCSNLKDIIIPDSISSIGNNAFLDCKGVISITCYAINPPATRTTSFSHIDTSIPVYVPAESIGTYQETDGWSDFTNIQVIPCPPVSGECGAEGANLTWELSCDSVLTISGTGTMEEYSGSSSVPWHNYSDMIRKAVITEGVTSLSSSTFENCTTLVSVTIPEGITELGMYTFANCSSLKAVDLPSTITSIGSYCFSECWYIDSIICRATTPPVANGSSLSGVNYMIPIYVPAGTTDQYMDAEGWSGFTDYRAIDGGSQACTIASGSCGADGNNLMWVLTCDSVLTIYGEGEMPSSYASNATPWYEYGQSIKHINIEEGVTKLALNSFYNSGASANYPNVRTLSIPSTLGAPIETNFFYGCPLKTVTILSDTIVGKASYSSNNSLQNKFGAQVEEYIIGESVRSIANFAFYNQSPDSLCSIYLPEGLEAIGNWAFGYIDHLTSVTVPSTVQTIGTDAFAGCSNLRSVELGEGLMTVNGQAFWMCDNLTQVTCYAMNPPTLNSTSFDHYDTLIVRCEAKSLYQEADYWKNFTPILCPDDTTGSYVEPDAPEQITFALDSSWKFIMLPTLFGMIQDDIIVDGGEIEWGTYNSEQRAAGLSGWQGFVPSSGFSASRSYIIRARNGSATLTIKVPEQAREKAGAAIPFAYNESAHQQNANWNFLGNPYPFSYDIMAALLAQGITSPIAVWNGIGYITYTPGIDVKILDPFEAFFIQMPQNGVQAIQYTPEYIVADNGSMNTGDDIIDSYGALPGRFSVGEGVQIQFSRGNLQYQASTYTWRFAENQFDKIGEDNANISESYEGWIDWFGWGTGDYPTKSITSYDDYSTFVDWGTNAISNGGNKANLWRTLTNDEWGYLFQGRTNATALYGHSTIEGIIGMIILPDDWQNIADILFTSGTGDFSQNTYTTEQWSEMEATGAVFLPAAGYRDGTVVQDIGSYGLYWSSTPNDNHTAYSAFFSSSNLNPQGNETNYSGMSVRLVK